MRAGAHADCICYITEDLAKAEADKGAGLRLVVSTALGARGKLVESLAELAGAMEASDVAVVTLVKEGADCEAMGLPAGVVVWTRPQFVQAVARSSFAGQEPYWEN